MMKICVIDDEWICSFLAQKLIKKLLPNSQLLQFKNGLEAIEFIDQHKFSPKSLPEFILLDINMPVANGWDFLDMLNGLNISDYNPVIYISSSSQDPEDLAMARTYSSVHGCIPKPLTPSKLSSAFDNTGQDLLC